jgi:AhpD family alkylhydroperoxidase
MDKFKRRIYSSLGDLVTDTREIMSHRDVLRSTMRGGLDPAFRERLMLVVTGVNGCRYCSYAHARQALSEGISEEEIEMLGERAFHGSPTEDVPALLYAQHWAEADGQPDPAVRATVVERYGEATVERMEIILRMIRMGNLLGNTLDYLLHRISFGRLGGAGGPTADAEPSG